CLPPDSEPALPNELISAVIDACRHPQPIGWGLDPALEGVIAQFTKSSEPADVAGAQLVCLAEAFERVVVDELPEHERIEAVRRLDMVVQRAIIALNQAEVARLRAAALTDPLTGMFNRRAFTQDLERAAAHHDRTGEPFTVVMVDLVGLKHINDTLGHAGGDAALQAMAAAIRIATRADDRGYRVGGDEFALLLPNTILPEPDEFVRRLQQAGAPDCTVGIASAPTDALDELVELADHRLYETRRAQARVR